MEVIGAQLAAVVAGANRLDAGTAGGVDAGTHRAVDRRRVEPVEHDFEHGIDPVGQFGFRPRAHGRTVGVVGRGDHSRVAAGANLAAAADYAAGEREDHAGHALDRADSSFGCRQPAVAGLGEYQKVAAADALFLDAEALLQETLAFHDRNAPVALAADDLADLQLVAEHPERAAGGQPIGRVGKTVEAAGGRTRQHRLADALGQALAEAVHVHGEEQNGNPGTRVRCLRRRKLALNARFALAGDDRRGETGELQRRLARPFVGARRDDQPRRAHAERLGKRILDEDAANLHVSPRWHTARRTDALDSDRTTRLNTDRSSAATGIRSRDRTPAAHADACLPARGAAAPPRRRGSPP